MMNKILNIFLIALASLLIFLILTVSIASWIVFTPERVTPIVRNQAGKFLTCESEIGEVELTFFSTYPELGLRVNRFALINPVTGAPSDTLVRVDEFTGIIDAMAWWKRKEWILKGVEMSGGSINIFSDSLGNTNYDIFSSDTTVTADTKTGSVPLIIDIQKVVLEDINLHYRDLSAKLNALVVGLETRMAGSVTEDNISGRVEVKNSGISLEYDGEDYLDQASVKLDLPIDLVPSRQFIKLDNARLSVNGLEIGLNGTLENDTLKQILLTDLSYEFSSWPVEDMMALVPPSFQRYLEGINGDGLLTSSGTIEGQLSDSIMPLLDIRLQLANGTLDYDELPLPLHDIRGDIRFYSDLKTDEISYVQIHRFDAKTPGSSLKLSGKVKHLFSNIYCDLATDSRLRLEEFTPMLPDSLELDLTGLATGQVNAAFTLDQVKKMQLEKMRLSGSLTLQDLDAAYDSLSVSTGRTKLDFRLPNFNPSSKNTGFTFATLRSDDLSAGKPDSYRSYLQNASFTLETSDVRDTTRIPDIICSFSIDSIHATMDTLSLALLQPAGKVHLSPRPESPDQPRIVLSYNCGKLESTLGQNRASMEAISLETDILNDNSQDDIFLRWLARGFVDLDRGSITLSGYPYPVEIPSVKMDFEPETFRIEEASVKLDQSDFSLHGDLNNVLSYFRGDSILRGNFLFASDTTDVEQILALSSGLGSKDTTKIQQAEVSNADTSYKGPYMVPRGIDVLLTTDIKTATLGMDTARDITGDVRVKDGVLVLGELSFVTPAARMQLTSMYRTPRKNHIYAGLDYHMLDVEIEELLTMIPDIDTLMPMLRSFKGKGEFHLAIETYLDSTYNIKKSTLRGASSIRGNDLVLMDGETFSEISQKLRFSKKAENKVDSLSAEFTIFRNEIDIYPFLIVMDKYAAVIAGRHNFDMSFDYHVSIVDSPIPVKLGLDIKGNMEDLDIDLAQCRYKEFYRPVSRKAVENKQLELRKMIRDILTQKVKE